MAKSSGSTRAVNSSNKATASNSWEGRNLNVGSMWEQTVQGNTISYDISYNDKTRNYQLNSHENLGDLQRYSNDIQESAETIEELRRKIRKGGYF